MRFNQNQSDHIISTNFKLDFFSAHLMVICYFMVTCMSVQVSVVGYPNCNHFNNPPSSIDTFLCPNT